MAFLTSLIKLSAKRCGTAPASVNIYDWYKIGAYFCGLPNRRFYNTIDDTYKDISDLLTRAHVSDATLGAFNDWLGFVKSLPKEFSTWTMEEYDTFPNSPEWRGTRKRNVDGWAFLSGIKVPVISSFFSSFKRPHGLP